MLVTDVGESDGDKMCLKSLWSWWSPTSATGITFRHILMLVIDFYVTNIWKWYQLEATNKPTVTFVRKNSICAKCKIGALVSILNQFSYVIDQENTHHLHPTFHDITLLLLYDSLHRFFTINPPSWISFMLTTPINEKFQHEKCHCFCWAT